MALKIDFDRFYADTSARFKEIITKRAREEESKRGFVEPEDVGEKLYEEYDKMLKNLSEYIKIVTPDGEYTIEEYRNKLKTRAAQRTGELNDYLESLEDGVYDVKEISKRLTLLIISQDSFLRRSIRSG